MTSTVQTLVIALVVALVTFFARQLWDMSSEKLRYRRKLNEALKLYERRIYSNQSPQGLSKILIELKNFLLENPSLLNRSGVRQFFDDWLKDSQLDSPEGLHSRLKQDPWDAILRLRIDVIIQLT